METTPILQAVITIEGNLGIYSFPFSVYRSSSKEEQIIEEEFYKERSFTKNAPNGRHHEIEVLIGGVSSPVPIEKKATPFLHQPKMCPGKFFISWTGPIENMEKARAVMKLWSIGTAYTIELGKDFTENFSLDMRNGVGSDDLDRIRWKIQDFGFRIKKAICE